MFFHACNHGGCQMDGKETVDWIILSVNEKVGLETCKWKTMLFIVWLDRSNWYLMATEVVWMDARGWKVFSDLIQTVPTERLTVFINAKHIEMCFLLYWEENIFCKYSIHKESKYCSGCNFSLKRGEYPIRKFCKVPSRTQYLLNAGV